MIATKADVQTSYHQGYHGRPMVNVKVRAFPLLSQGFKAFRRENPDAPARFTEEWVDGLGEEYLDGVFWMVCGWRFEDLESEAQEIFGDHVKVYSAGRSGGWAVVEGLDDVSEWDAVQLAKWRRFEKYARATAEHVPADIIESLYINEWETAEAEAQARYVEAEPAIEEAAFAVSRP